MTLDFIKQFVKLKYFFEYNTSVKYDKLNEINLIKSITTHRKKAVLNGNNYNPDTTVRKRNKIRKKYYNA